MPTANKQKPNSSANWNERIINKLQNSHSGDVCYSFDPVDNISTIKDGAQADVFYDGELIKVLNNYEFGKIGRLHLNAMRTVSSKGNSEADPLIRASADLSLLTVHHILHSDTTSGLRTVKQQIRPHHF